MKNKHNRKGSKNPQKSSNSCRPHVHGCSSASRLPADESCHVSFARENRTSYKYAYSEYKIPVFIGVTGHRAFRENKGDLQNLRSALKGELRALVEDHPNTDFVLLTALAAGADQLAADVVNELSAEIAADKADKASITVGAGSDSPYSKRLRYAVILPMPADVYFNRTTENHSTGKAEPDFTKAQKDQAARLMSSENCAFIYEIPLAAEQGVTLENVAKPRNSDIQFSEAALFIADNSYLGIALWDGTLSPYAVAGTGSAVRDSLHGKKYRSNLISGLTLPETRPIYHIYTPRENAPATSYDYKVRRLFPAPLLETGDSWFTIDSENLTESEIEALFSDNSLSTEKKELKTAFLANLKTIDRYNGEVIRYKDKIDCGDDYLGLDDCDLTDTRAAIYRHYYKASDQLACIYQKKRNRWIVAIILIASFAYALLGFFPFPFSHHILLIMYILLLVGVWGIWKWVENRALHTRFVDYRAIAEGLRVQFYWSCADLTAHDEPAQVQDYYLRKQIAQIEWVRHAIRGINLIALTYPAKTPADMHELKRIADTWLGKANIFFDDKWQSPVLKIKSNGQAGYFKDKCSVVQKKDKKYDRVVFGTVVGSLGAVLLLISILLILPDCQYKELITETAMLIAGFLPILAMALREISAKMGYQEDIERSKWYHLIFSRAINEIEEVYVLSPAGAEIVAKTAAADAAAKKAAEADMAQKEAEKHPFRTTLIAIIITLKKAFTAMLAAVKRACVAVKDALIKLLMPEASASKKKSKKQDDRPEKKTVCSAPEPPVAPKDSDIELAIRKKLFDIGKEALRENADWVILNVKRAPEVPSS